jgi:excisionase family DNA binding protein
MDRAVFTVAEFCAAFRISRAHLYNLIGRGEGPAYFKAGKRTLIHSDSAEAWARRMEARAAARPTRGEGRP